MIRPLPTSRASRAWATALGVWAGEGGGGGRGDAVLAGAGLGDDPPLAHLAGEQGLADRVVDLVRAGVQEVLALEEDAGAAELMGQALGEEERRRAADAVAHDVGGTAA